MAGRLLPRRLAGICLLIGSGCCSTAMALGQPFHRLSADEIQRETLAQWSLEADALCFAFLFRGRAARECFEIWRSGELIDYRRDGVPVVEGVLREPK
jgi:hypothetical protein